MLKGVENGTPAASDRNSDAVHESLERYWRANVRVMAVLLAIWAVVGLGCGVLFAGWLNQYHLGGYPLGFWFAQQGSIVVFVVLILVYALVLNRLDRRHHEELERLKGAGTKLDPLAGGGQTAGAQPDMQNHRGEG